MNPLTRIPPSDPHPEPGETLKDPPDPSSVEKFQRLLDGKNPDEETNSGEQMSDGQAGEGEDIAGIHDMADKPNVPELPGAVATSTPREGPVDPGSPVGKGATNPGTPEDSDAMTSSRTVLQKKAESGSRPPLQGSAATGGKDKVPGVPTPTPSPVRKSDSLPTTSPTTDPPARETGNPMPSHPEKTSSSPNPNAVESKSRTPKQSPGARPKVPMTGSPVPPEETTGGDPVKKATEPSAPDVESSARKDFEKKSTSPDHVQEGSVHPQSGPAAATVQAPKSPAASSGSDRLMESVEHIANLLADTVSSVTLSGNSASVQLNETRLPGTSFQLVVANARVVLSFHCNNAGSQNVLQARVGEVLSQLGVRFQQPVKIEINGELVAGEEDIGEGPQPDGDNEVVREESPGKGEGGPVHG